MLSNDECYFRLHLVRRLESDFQSDPMRQFLSYKVYVFILSLLSICLSFYPIVIAGHIEFYASKLYFNFFPLKYQEYRCVYIYIFVTF